MARLKKPKACWDVERIATDMALRGWNSVLLGQAAGLSSKTIDRFLAGEVQTAKTAKAIAEAFGYTAKRYLSHIEAVA